MKTMFSMGFGQDVFGSRAMNPTLGLMRPRQRMGDMLDGDDLLRKLRAADAKVSAARDFVSAHPDQDTALGNDYIMFQNWTATADSASATVSDVEERLQGIGPGGQIEVTSDEYAILKNYMEAATVLSGIVGRHQTRLPIQKLGPDGRPIAATPAAAAAPVKNDLTAPLLVGGGVLAIGVIALLARA